MRPSGVIVSSLLLLGLTAFACQPAADTAAEEQAIRGHTDSLNAWLVAHNDSAIAMMYADNAVQMPPGQENMSGREAIHQGYAGMWAMNPTLVLHPTTVSVSSSGDMAIVAGTWEFTGTTPAGTMSDTGRYLEHWHKVDGHWQIVHDIWNSNNPPPAAPDSVAS